jgi:hypothetical protein
MTHPTRKRPRHIGAWLGLVLAAAFAFAACGGGSSQNGDGGSFGTGDEGSFGTGDEGSGGMQPMESGGTGY